MGSFVGHRPTRLRLSADTSGKAAIIKKKTAFRAGYFSKIDRSQKLSMKACMKSLTPEIQDFLSHWSLSVSATSSFSMQRSDYRKFRSKEMWPFLSFIFISVQRLALTTLSVLTLFHSLVNPYSRNSKDMTSQGSGKKQTHEDRKLDRLLSTSSLLLSILCCIAIFHMELRIQEHRRLISHSSTGTFRDEMVTEILRKVQQECRSWRETKDSHLKGDWQTTTFCHVLCSLHLFAMRYRFSSVSGAISEQFNFFSNCISDPER